MRIMHVNDQYCSDGGTEQYLRSVARALECAGHEVSVVYQNRRDAVSEQDSRPMYCIPESQERRSKRACLRDMLDHECPDIVHFHNVFDVELLRMTTEFRPTLRLIHDHRLYCFRESKVLPRSERRCTQPVGIRCAFSGCTSRNPWMLLPLLSAKAMELRTNHSLDRFMVHTQFMRNCLVENGFDTQRIHVLPSFVSKDLWDSAEKIDSSQNYLLYVGRLHPSKGPQVLLKAFAMVPAVHQLVIVGHGMYLDDLRREAHDLGVAKRVRFATASGCAEMSRFYANCTAVVVPSLWEEPFGLVGCEAMAHGKPVIAFDVGGVSEWLEHGRSGLLVPPADVAALAQAIVRLLDDLELSNTLGAHGRQRARALYHPDVHVNGLLDIYRATIAASIG